MTKKGEGEAIKEEGPNEDLDDLNKDDVISSNKSPLKLQEPKIELPSIKLPIVKRLFEKGLGPKMQVTSQSEGFGTVRIRHHKAFYGIITHFKAHAVEKVIKIIKIEKEPLPASPSPQPKAKKAPPKTDPLPEESPKKEVKEITENNDGSKEEQKEEESPPKIKSPTRIKKRPESARSEKDETS
jgi:hypothetical protein